jgi:hypothetical protein
VIPDGRLDDNFSVTAVATLVAGSVIELAVTPLIAPKLTVVDDVVDVVVEADELEEDEPDDDELGVLLPPPPHAESAVAKTTPRRTHDKRGQRTILPPTKTLGCSPSLACLADFWCPS